jgi:hypothetical protein
MCSAARGASEGAASWRAARRWSAGIVGGGCAEGAMRPGGGAASGMGRGWRVGRSDVDTDAAAGVGSCGAVRGRDGGATPVGAAGCAAWGWAGGRATSGVGIDIAARGAAGCHGGAASIGPGGFGVAGGRAVSDAVAAAGGGSGGAALGRNSRRGGRSIGMPVPCGEGASLLK